MAAKGTNRYALFGDNGNASPISSPTTNVGSNPFANQVADDSGPWQEVKKRGAAAAQPVAPGKVHGGMQGARERTISISGEPKVL